MSEAKDLLPRVAAGDTSAVDLCVGRYGPLVWSLAKRYCRDHHLAEDAVQDVFIELWKVADRYDPEVAREKTFVAMIARRRLIDGLRRAGSRRQTVALPEADDAPAADGNPADPIDTADEAAAARRALAELPEDQRRAIRLSIEAGQSHAQISETLDVPLGTVKTRIRRGLIAIREKLTGPRPQPSAEVHA